jgi:hypothetical protein
MGVVAVILSVGWFALWWFNRRPGARREGETEWSYERRKGLRYLAPFVSLVLLVTGTYLIIS